MPGFPAVSDDESSVTPHRKTEAFFNCAEPIANRHPWHVTRHGLDIARVADPGNVMLLPSGSWCARSLQADQLFEYGDMLGALMSYPPYTMTVTDEIVTYPNVQSQVPLGIVPAGYYTAYAGDYWCLRQVKAGFLWNHNLIGDALAFPSPVPANQLMPMLRLGVGNGRNLAAFATTPNTGFCLRVMPSIRITDDADAIGIFMFGGPAAVLPSNNAGGEFALVLMASGDALVYERCGLKTAPGWKLLRRVKWAQRGQVSGRAHSILVIPEGGNTLNVLAGGHGPTTVQRYESGAVVSGDVLTAGYASKRTTTGVGPVRMDLRADLRVPFQITELMFQGTQAIVDGLPIQTGPVLRGDPFMVGFPMGANTEITVDVDKEELDGTSIKVRLFTVNGDVECAKATNGAFLSVAGRQAYYPTFTFNFIPFGSTGGNNVYTGFKTPFLYAYTAHVDGVIVLNTNDPFQGGTVTHVDVTGQDLEVGTESCGLLLEDLTDAVRTGQIGQGGLANRADTRLIVQTAYDPIQTGRRCRLFDGIMVNASGSLRPGTHGGYPSFNWHSYHITGQGQWRRVAQPGQTNWRRKDFTVDSAAGIDPQTGTPFPLRVTEILDLLLESAGYTSAYRNVRPPEWDFLRIFTNGRNNKDWYVEPGARLADVIEYICKQYLGAVLHWDANYADGQWTLLFPPKFSAAGNYTFKYNFITTATGKPGGLVHRPETYPANTTFIQRITEHPEAPEANYVRVIAAPTIGDYPDKIPDGVHGASVSASLYNYRAVAPDPNNDRTDPTSLDYVNGQMRSLVWVEPALYVPGDINKTFQAVRWSCRRLFDAVAYGRLYKQWHAPLVFVTHERDPVRVRPLQTYDLVSIDGEAVVLDSCPSIAYKWDGKQMADYSGFVIPEPLPVVIGPGDNSGFQ